MIILGSIVFNDFETILSWTTCELEIKNARISRKMIAWNSETILNSLEIVADDIVKEGSCR
jgi:hypothetical protein